MKKKVSVFVLVLGMMVSFVVGTAAAGGIQEITAYLDPTITVKLEGEVQTFLDANGIRVYPIAYQGSTYLPVRAVAGLAGFEANWDQETRTVELGQVKGVDLIDTYKVYHVSSSQWVSQVQSTDKRTKEISGISCDHWLCFIDGRSGSAIHSASYNLLGKHDTLTFNYYADEDITLMVLGDNDTVLGEFPISGGAVAKTITIPLYKTSELKFQVQGTGNVMIFNAYLDAEE